MHSSDYLTSWNKSKTLVVLLFLMISLIGLSISYFSVDNKEEISKISCSLCSEKNKACPEGQSCSNPIKPCFPKVIRSFSLSESSYFDFNAPTLRPESKEELEILLKSNVFGLKEVKIKIVGHADPIGSTEYNDKLSLERALSVKNFLITHAILKESQISVEGKGENQPIKHIKERCEADKLIRADLIKCYQPLRRVNISVEGHQDENLTESHEIYGY